MLCAAIRERLRCLRNFYQPALPFSYGRLGLFFRQDAKLATKFLLTGENRGNKVFDSSLLSPLPPVKQSILIPSPALAPFAPLREIFPILVAAFFGSTPPLAVSSR